MRWIWINRFMHYCEKSCKILKTGGEKCDQVSEWVTWKVNYLIEINFLISSEHVKNSTKHNLFHLIGRSTARGNLTLSSIISDRVYPTCTRSSHTWEIKFHSAQFTRRHRSRDRRSRRRESVNSTSILSPPLCLVLFSFVKGKKIIISQTITRFNLIYFPSFIFFSTPSCVRCWLFSLVFFAASSIHRESHSLQRVFGDRSHSLGENLPPYKDK